MILFTHLKVKAEGVKVKVNGVGLEKERHSANVSGDFVGAKVFVIGAEEDLCFALGGDGSLLEEDLVKERAKEKICLCLKVKEVKVKVKAKAKVKVAVLERPKVKVKGRPCVTTAALVIIGLINPLMVKARAVSYTHLTLPTKA